MVIGNGHPFRGISVKAGPETGAARLQAFARNRRLFAWAGPCFHSTGTRANVCVVTWPVGARAARYLRSNWKNSRTSTRRTRARRTRVSTDTLNSPRSTPET